jgi:hypothetical protein
MNNFPAQWTVFGNTDGMQQPFDAAVVMPSIGRAEVLKAVQSVYDQTCVQRIQLLIGVDKAIGDLSPLIALLNETPAHVTPCLFYPGYSTSVRHGGVTRSCDGGSLRTSLTFLANTQYVAYLDDDNWWAPEHLRQLLTAIEGRAWAFSYRWFVHPVSKKAICVDGWESVGPGKGVFVEKFGGFVDPNCLMLDKLVCWAGIGLWTQPLINDTKGMAADRNVYNYLQNHSEPGRTGNATAFYVLDPADGMHPYRMQGFGDRYAAMAE